MFVVCLYLFPNKLILDCIVNQRRLLSFVHGPFYFPGSVKGGAGGGYLHWKVGKLLEMNGLLAARGLNGTGSNAGGGSGGSILVETTNITGHGMEAKYKTLHCSRQRAYFYFA